MMYPTPSRIHVDHRRTVEPGPGSSLGAARASLASRPAMGDGRRGGDGSHKDGEVPGELQLESHSAVGKMMMIGIGIGGRHRFLIWVLVWKWVFVAKWLFWQWWSSNGWNGVAYFQTHHIYHTISSWINWEFTYRPWDSLSLRKAVGSACKPNGERRSGDRTDVSGDGSRSDWVICKPDISPPQWWYIWVNYNDLTATSL